MCLVAATLLNLHSAEQWQLFLYSNSIVTAFFRICNVPQSSLHAFVMWRASVAHGSIRINSIDCEIDERTTAHQMIHYSCSSHTWVRVAAVGRGPGSRCLVESSRGTSQSARP